jgi:hypothetical protein
MRAAGDDTPTLPEDAAALRALLLETLARVDTLAAERDALASRDPPPLKWSAPRYGLEPEEDRDGEQEAPA